MTAPLVYIAAPLGAPTPTLRRWHRERARLLACLALARGYIPVWVHEVAEQALGDDTDPAARRKGLDLALQALERVYTADGRFWVLLNNDCSFSAGCRAEHARWSYLDEINRREGASRTLTVSTWTHWRDDVVARAPHLLSAWDRLARRPSESP